MRVIKYRAWVNGKMYYDAFGTREKAYGMLVDFKYPVDDLMQYTGLKDNSGREIYEGDVITNHGVTNDMKQRRFEIVWVLDTARFAAYDAIARMKTSISDSDMEDCEVIGNIYENPGLLNAVI